MRFIAVCSAPVPPVIQGALVGVGKSGDEDAIATVRGAEGGSRKTVPLKLVPALGQASEYLSEEVSGSSSGRAHSSESCDVFHEAVAGSKLANDSELLAPKRSLGMPKASAPAGGGDSLAGESSGDEVDALGVVPDVSDVLVEGDSGEPEGEELSPELVLFAEPSVLESCEVEPVGEQPASVE